MTNKKEPKTYIITEEVLSRIRETVGSQIPETGGILGSSDGKHVDHFYFDVTASVTGATYEPDCDKLNLIIQKWYEKTVSDSCGNAAGWKHFSDDRQYGSGRSGIHAEQTIPQAL